MTVHQDITISCDVHGCGVVFVSEDSTRSEAEVRAEAAGWLLPDDGHDRCPECADLHDPS